MIFKTMYICVFLNLTFLLIMLGCVLRLLAIVSLTPKKTSILYLFFMLVLILYLFYLAQHCCLIEIDSAAAKGAAAAKGGYDPQYPYKVAGKYDYRRYSNKPYWDRLKLIGFKSRTLRYHEHLLSWVQPMSGKEVYEASTVCAFHKYIKISPGGLFVGFLTIIAGSIASPFGIGFEIYDDCFKITPLRQKREPGVAVLMKLSTITFRSQFPILVAATILCFCISSITFWGPYCKLIIYISDFVHMINLNCGTKFPLMANTPRMIGYAPWAVIVINMMIIFVPLIVYTIFYLITLLFVAPKFVDKLAWVLSFFLFIFIILGNIATILALFDALYYVGIYQIYMDLLMSAFKSVGITKFDIPEVYIPLVYAPTVAMAIGLFCLLLDHLDINLYVTNPQVVAEAYDCRTNIFSLHRNKNIMMIITEQGSTQLKMCFMTLIFDDKIMDFDNLNTKALAAVIKRRSAYRVQLEYYAKEYKFIFKRSSVDYYLKIYNAIMWTDEKRDLSIDRLDTLCRMESILKKAEQKKKLAKTPSTYDL